jgi:hypothetical protein
MKKKKLAPIDAMARDMKLYTNWYPCSGLMYDLQKSMRPLSAAGEIMTQSAPLLWNRNNPTHPQGM